jgi:hypothetical protein
MNLSRISPTLGGASRVLGCTASGLNHAQAETAYRNASGYLMAFGAVMALHARRAKADPGTCCVAGTDRLWLERLGRVADV